jgi:hypothetical protein
MSLQKLQKGLQAPVLILLLEKHSHTTQQQNKWNYHDYK